MRHCASCHVVIPELQNSKYCPACRRIARGRWLQKIRDSATAKESRDSEFRRLWNTAKAAGLAAGERVRPEPMHVVQHANMADDSSPVVKAWEVSEGTCGFAWVVIRHATCSFARWLAKNGLGGRGYGGGCHVWIREHNQSLERKDMHAEAMAKVFKDAGLYAIACSRMD